MYRGAAGSALPKEHLPFPSYPGSSSLGPTMNVQTLKLPDDTLNLWDH